MIISLWSQRADTYQALLKHAQSKRTAKPSWMQSIFSPMISHQVPNHWFGREALKQLLPILTCSGHISTQPKAALTSLTELIGHCLPPREQRETRVTREIKASRVRRARPEPQVLQALQSHGREALQQLRLILNCIGLITMKAMAALTSMMEMTGLFLQPRATRVTRESRAHRERMVRMEPQVQPERLEQTENLSSGKAVSLQKMNFRILSSCGRSITQRMALHTFTMVLLGLCLLLREQRETRVTRAIPVIQALQSHGREALQQLLQILNCIGHITTRLMVALIFLMEPTGHFLPKREKRVIKESRALRERMVRMEPQAQPERLEQTENLSSGKAVSLQKMNFRILSSCGRSITQRMALHTFTMVLLGLCLLLREQRETRVIRECRASRVKPVKPALLSHGREDLQQIRLILNCIGHITTQQTVAHISLTEPNGHFLPKRATRVIRESRASRARRVILVRQVQLV